MRKSPSLPFHTILMKEPMVLVFLTSVLLCLLCLNSSQHGDKPIWQSLVVPWSSGGLILGATKSVDIPFAFRFGVDFALFPKLPSEGKCLLAVWLPTPLPSSASHEPRSETPSGCYSLAEACLWKQNPAFLHVPHALPTGKAHLSPIFTSLGSRGCHCLGTRQSLQSVPLILACQYG